MQIEVTPCVQPAKARRIAANIVKLPELCEALNQISRIDSSARTAARSKPYTPSTRPC
jgi:hypothetical protein